MAIELIIKIPQKVYEDCIMIPSDIKEWKHEISKAFENGIVLQEGHGKIIDVDQFYKAFNEYQSECRCFSFADIETILNVITPPILKADKEIENEHTSEQL